MWLAALLLFQAPAPVDVAVQPLSGAQQAGVLVALDSEHMVLDVGGQQQTYGVRDLLTLIVQPVADPSLSEARIFVDMVGGSTLRGTGYRVTNRTASLQIGDRPIVLETRDVHAVRFHPPAIALDDQWREITDGDNQGDVIVLRRSESALDQLEGVFHDVSDETVEFEYDDERILVKRTKLEGLVYYHPVGRELPAAICVVQETGGTRWKARSIELQQDQLQLVTTDGTKGEIPWSAVARLDFSSGNVVYLSDLEFDLVECEPFYASRLPLEHIKQTYGPKRDRSFSGPGLWLNSDHGGLQKFEKGLAVHSRSELVYRLTEPYRRLTAVVGIDSRPRQRGNLVLVIAGDRSELFRRTISGADAPIALDLNIEGVRRLRILVDYGDALDVADHLNLCNARIFK